MVFDDVWVYCGDPEAIDNEEICKLKEEYGIVWPICNACRLQKPVKIRNAKKKFKRDDNEALYMPKMLEI